MGAVSGVEDGVKSALESSKLQPGYLDRSGYLPQDAPLAMPAQPLAKAGHKLRGERAGLRIAMRRGCILLITALLTLGGIHEIYQVFNVAGITVLEAVVLGLFVLLFAWIAFSCSSAVVGFLLLLFGRHDKPDDVRPTLASCNALLFPIYNEDPSAVFSRLQAISESVDGTGQGERFDVFVLSDTTNPDIWIAEERCFLDLLNRTGHSRIYYRHRLDNTARKAGNIASWVRQFGARYDHMIVMDADSLMTGDTIVRLAAAMERDPACGLIQTLPVIVNGRSLFARLQQFSGRLYGPLIGRGIAWWHGPESNYWGHNAIIRVSAFAENAGLPELTGRSPFGGHILSHDFVEAALMRRGGWSIRMAPHLGGSFEECPPSLIDYAERDRRWCQGNLQHLAVLPARGLHWVSRLHLLTGVGCYLTAPLWFAFLTVGILISLQAKFARPEYFPSGFSLFPQWPAQDPGRAVLVFAGTMGLLMLPKFLAYIVFLVRGPRRREFGGGIRVLMGILLETLISGLMAPIMMIFQSRAVAEIAAGRDAGWSVQRRNDGQVARSEVFRRCLPPTLVGTAMAASAYAVSVPLFLWMSPVVVGLLFAVPIVLMTSRAPTRSGDGAPRQSLLATPEDTNPPPLLVRANELGRQLANKTEARPALAALRADAALQEFHIRMLVPSGPRKRGQVDHHLAIARAKIDDAENFAEAASFLNPREVFSTLASPAMLREILSKHDSQSAASSQCSNWR